MSRNGNNSFLCENGDIEMWFMGFDISLCQIKTHHTGSIIIDFNFWNYRIHIVDCPIACCNKRTSVFMIVWDIF